MRRLFLPILAVPIWSIPFGFAAAQPALDRLEQDVRKQVEAGPPLPKSIVESPKRVPAEPPQPGGAKPAQERGYLGALTDDQGDRGRGVRILKITPGSPADKAGLKADDLVTGVGGVRVRAMDDFAAVIEQLGPGTLLTFEIQRGQQPLKIDVTLGTRPAAKLPAGPSLPGTVERPVTPSPAPASQDPVASIPAPPKDSMPAAPSSSLPKGITVIRPPATTPQSRIDSLEQRVRELETRVEQLERALRAKGQ